MVEVHPNPEEALSDGPQQLVPSAFEELIGRVRDVAALVEREV